MIFYVENLAAFWLAELIAAAAPLDSEPPAVLLVALVAYLALGLALGGAALLGRRLVGLPPARLDRWLAFAPGLALLLPKARLAFVAEPLESLLLLVVLASLTWLLGCVGLPPGREAFEHRAQTDEPRGPTAASTLSELMVYGWGCLALWIVALRFQALAFVAATHGPRLVPSPWLTAIAAGGCLLVALAAARWSDRRSAGALLALHGLAAGLLALRFLVPPPFAAEVERGGDAEGAAIAANAAEPATPVILIVLDTVRADHLSLYGYPRATTPSLEALAEEAVVFERAVSPSSWTLPSHASLFTGLSPLRHGALRLPGLEGDAERLEERGIVRPAYPLAGRFDTLAEWLAEQGYDTGAVVSNYAYLDPAFGISQGFAHYDAWRNVAVRPRILDVVHRRSRRLPWAARHWQVYRGARQVNRLALDWLRARRSDAVFLFLNYMEAHEPWGPHLPGLRYGRFAAEERPPATPFRPDAAPEMRRRIDLYDSQLASLDQALGELFAELRALGLWRRALVVVTSDHGESLGEHGIEGHGKSLHQPELAVPLVVKYPGGRRTGRSLERARLIDLWPTIARELGLEPPPGLEGRILGGGEIRDGGEPGADADRAATALAELYTDPREPADIFHGYRAALFEGRWKLLARSDGELRLFDLEADPAESIDRSAEHLGWAGERLAELLERRERLEAEALDMQDALEPLDPELEESLRALGYL